MGQVLSIMARSRSGAASTVITALFGIWIVQERARLHAARKKNAAPVIVKRGLGANRETKVQLNKVFVNQFKEIIKRGVGKRELFDIALLTITLLGRTLMSVYIALNMGQTIEHFCNKRWDETFKSIVHFGVCSTVAAILNAMIKYETSLLSLNVRQRLTQHIHKYYMKDIMYYRANKVADANGVVENADQLIADDVDKLSDAMGDVYANLIKPLVDVFMFTGQMMSMMGPVGPIGMYSWFGVGTIISAAVMPAYGKLAAQEQALEGRFRAAHADLIYNSEMVAFLGGEVPEQATLTRSFTAIRQHVLNMLTSKVSADAVTGYVNKYFASVVGFLLVVRPVYANVNGMGNWSPGEIAKYYVSLRQIMEGLTNAVLAIFDLQKRLGVLAGLTSRVCGLLKAIEARTPILEAQMQLHAATNPPKFVSGSELKFEHVWVYKPDGTLLVKDLSFTVPRGGRVIVTGDNGCGKTSLFRVLRGLWPLVAGTITKPADSEIFFLTQVNFVPTGTLAELITYPDSMATFQAKGHNDQYLLDCLKFAHLADFSCDGVKPNLSDTLDWGVSLSPGQKQRIAFCRVFYHRPAYAVLDECSNGISPEVEEDLYNRCHSLGIAVFSISHKVELRRLHDYRLHYLADGEGSYTFEQLQA